MEKSYTFSKSVSCIAFVRTRTPTKIAIILSKFLKIKYSWKYQFSSKNTWGKAAVFQSQSLSSHFISKKTVFQSRETVNLTWICMQENRYFQVVTLYAPGESADFERTVFIFINALVINAWTSEKKGRVWGRKFTSFEILPSTVLGELQIECLQIMWASNPVLITNGAESLQESSGVPKSHGKSIAECISGANQHAASSLSRACEASRAVGWSMGEDLACRTKPRGLERAGSEAGLVPPWTSYMTLSISL